jgi:hypothetical protein
MAENLENECLDCSNPSPSASCEPNLQSIGCKILFYLGEKSKITEDNILLGQLDNLYSAEGNDWKIEGYSVQDLIDAKILPDEMESGHFKEFVLTERELLSTETFESWQLFLGTYLQESVNDPSLPVPFGILVYQALGLQGDNLSDILLALQGLVDSISKGDIGSISNFSDKNTIFPYNIPIDKQNIYFQKLEACYDWIRNIYLENYGRKFLVKIGNQSPL